MEFNVRMSLLQNREVLQPLRLNSVPGWCRRHQVLIEGHGIERGLVFQNLGETAVG